MQSAQQRAVGWLAWGPQLMILSDVSLQEIQCEWWRERQKERVDGKGCGAVVKLHKL